MIPASIIRGLVAGAMTCIAATAAHAAVFTANTAGIEGFFNFDDKFADAKYDGRNLDVRYKTLIKRNRKDLIVIDTNAELATLWGLENPAKPVIVMYFVNRLQVCGTVGAGAELQAHELGHVFGLAHDPVPPGPEGDTFMTATGFGFSKVTEAQADTILASGFVQEEGATARTYFIEIQPVLITTPLPAAGLLLAGGLAAAAVAGRRRAA